MTSNSPAVASRSSQKQSENLKSTHHGEPKLPPLSSLSQEENIRLNEIQEEVREIYLKPLVQQHTKGGSIFYEDLKRSQTSGLEKISDFVLPLITTGDIDVEKISTMKSILQENLNVLHKSQIGCYEKAAKADIESYIDQFSPPPIPSLTSDSQNHKVGENNYDKERYIELCIIAAKKACEGWKLEFNKKEEFLIPGIREKAGLFFQKQEYYLKQQQPTAQNTAPDSKQNALEVSSKNISASSLVIDVDSGSQKINSVSKDMNATKSIVETQSSLACVNSFAVIEVEEEEDKERTNKVLENEHVMKESFKEIGVEEGEDDPEYNGENDEEDDGEEETENKIDSTENERENPEEKNTIPVKLGAQSKNQKRKLRKRPAHGATTSNTNNSDNTKRAQKLRRLNTNRNQKGNTRSGGGGRGARGRGRGKKKAGS